MRHAILKTLTLAGIARTKACHVLHPIKDLSSTRAKGYEIMGKRKADQTLNVEGETSTKKPKVSHTKPYTISFRSFSHLRRVDPINGSRDTRQPGKTKILKRVAGGCGLLATGDRSIVPNSNFLISYTR